MYRIDTLLKSDQKLFHTQDLAILWGMSNKNTLYTTIKRYVKKRILIPIHKGFYSTGVIDEIDPIRLGVGYLHSFAYLSCESILSQQGIIFQQSDYITLVSNKYIKFTLLDKHYFVRKLDQKYLLNPAGIMMENGVYKANIDRAAADLLYFNPQSHLDALDKITIKRVKEMRRKVYGL